MYFMDMSLHFVKAAALKHGGYLQEGRKGYSGPMYPPSNPVRSKV
jgi:hypothetical protein